jgi:RNA polymerase sigma-70 factor (ECF subfamily)
VRSIESTIDLARLVASGPASPAQAAETEALVLSLFDRFRDPLLRYAWSLGLDGSDGEDLVQDVFLALFKHIRRGGARTNLQGWLFRVAHNLALKRRARRRKDSSRVSAALDIAEGLLHPGHDPEKQLADRQEHQRLQHVLAALPERDRQCLYLRREGLRYREIADVLGVSLGTVAKSVTRALARLRRAAG